MALVNERSRLERKGRSREGEGTEKGKRGRGVSWSVQGIQRLETQSEDLRPY